MSVLHKIILIANRIIVFIIGESDFIVKRAGCIVTVLLSMHVYNNQKTVCGVFISVVWGTLNCIDCNVIYIKLSFLACL